MSAEQKLMVEQLDVDNYATWSIRMKALLISKGLWAPVVEATPTDVAQDLRALAQIILHVKDHHLQTVASCATSKAAWDTLQATYEAKTNARKLLLRREMTHLKMSATEPLTKYAARAKDIQMQLRTAGDDINDQEVALQFLAGLPPSYGMISTVLMAGETTLTVESMLPKLLPVEQMAQPDHHSPEAALLAQPNRGGNSTQQTRETRKCYYCGKLGHLARQCKKKQRDYAHQRQQPQQQQQQQQRGAIAFSAPEIADNSGDQRPMRWVLDTGASRHITCDYDMLLNPSPPTDDVTITFGNGGKGKAEAIGQVLLTTKEAKFLLTDVLYIPEATENLISVRHAAQHGAEFAFSADSCVISHNGHIVAVAPCRNDAVYYLSGNGTLPPSAQHCNTALTARTAKESAQLWHERYGHLLNYRPRKGANPEGFIHLLYLRVAYIVAIGISLNTPPRAPLYQATRSSANPGRNSRV